MKNRNLRRCVLAFLGCAHAITAAAAPAATTSGTLGDEWVPMDPARLAGMRGGMVLPSGLSLSFGIDRLVYVNGDLVASTRVHIADIARMSGDDAAKLATLQQGTVVQLGNGNVIGPGPANGGLVIQNTLDNQDIRALTRVQVGVDTLDMLQEINSFDALHSALIASPGGP